MPIVQPHKVRHSTQEDGNTLKIIIPGHKNFFAVLMFVWWLFCFSFGEVLVGVMLFWVIKGMLSSSSVISNAGGLGFVLLVLLLLTAGWAFTLYSLLWQLVGKEKIEICSGSIKIQRVIFGRGCTKEYLASYIKDLRVPPEFIGTGYFGVFRPAKIWGNSGGFLAFDYGAKTYHFGGGVEEAEAKQIREKIISRFPGYGSTM